MSKLFRKIISVGVLTSFGLLSSCTGSTTVPSTTEPSMDVSSTPTGAPQSKINLNGEGPWNGALYMATSTNGLDFNGKDLILERAGVPNLLLLPDQTLVLSYQYFSTEDPSLFNVIAYSTSEDSGKTWTEPKAVTLENMPEGQMEDFKAMDPTLIRLENGTYRLYFTFHAQGNQHACLYSANSASAALDSTFTVESEPALCLNEENLLDPSVVYFNGLWHHYSWKDGSDNNVHSTSTDGVTFTEQDSISLPMDFLGQVIPYEDGLRFYGTGTGQLVVASSTDGSDWEIIKKISVEGADPGVATLADGTTVMIYTSKNFNVK